MANNLHLEKLKEGVEPWNEWVRIQRMRPTSIPTRHEGAKVGVSGFWADLSCADLHGVDLYQGKPGGGLSGIDLIGADLRQSDLPFAKLAWANLTGATLAGADLTGANLMSARLDGANLSRVNLSEALRRQPVDGKSPFLTAQQGLPIRNQVLGYRSICCNWPGQLYVRGTLHPGPPHAPGLWCTSTGVPTGMSLPESLIEYRRPLRRLRFTIPAL